MGGIVIENPELHSRDWFINKFEAIPEDQWCIQDYTDSMGRHCAIGHCKDFESLNFTPEAANLRELFTGHKITMINDGEDERYKQETPKQRILAALRDLT